VDPVACSSDNTKEPLGGKCENTDDDKLETSFETVIHYNSKSSTVWSESTPAPAKTGRTKKSLGRRKSTKAQSTPKTGLYPELTVYPDLSGVDRGVPTTSTEEFGTIAEGILEEMSTRIAGSPTVSKTNGSKATIPRNQNWPTSSTNLRRYYCPFEGISTAKYRSIKKPLQRRS
jgi:hypothetical protein